MGLSQTRRPRDRPTASGRHTTTDDQTTHALEHLLLPPTMMSSSSHVFTSAADDIREGSKRAADAFMTATGTDTVAFADVVDVCRYWSGLFCVVVTFCVFGPYLLSMHTFVSLWRRLGRVPTVLAHVGLSSALVLRISSSPLVREAIMNAFGGDLGFPTRYACAAAGLLVVASIWLKMQWMRDMDIATATGWVGELERGGGGGQLLTSGVYSIVRHPRYAQILVSSSLPPSSSRALGYLVHTLYRYYSLCDHIHILKQWYHDERRDVNLQQSHKAHEATSFKVWDHCRIMGGNLFISILQSLFLSEASPAPWDQVFFF